MITCAISSHCIVSMIDWKDNGKTLLINTVVIYVITQIYKVSDEHHQEALSISDVQMLLYMSLNLSAWSINQTLYVQSSTPI